MRQIFIIALSVIITSCAGSQKSASVSQTSTLSNDREYQIGAYLWQQTSGEYRALTYQAYNLARMLVEQDLQNKHNKKRAVIFDIDETVLDNSYGGAYEIKNQIPWSEDQFAEWVKQKRAVAVPGALEFIKFLTENRVEVFYISNRRTDMFDDTYANLLSQGFPVKKENLLLKSTTSSKEVRRQQVAARYEIVLLIGDNLIDHHAAFDKKNVAERNALVDQMKAEFGRRFIVLPNPLYGDWENALGREKSRIHYLKENP